MKWKWSQQCTQAFQVHYDPSLQVTLARDASAYGLGAVIITPKVEKEALSLIFGVKKFHQYLYGRRFMLITDHRPQTTNQFSNTG